MPQVCGHICKCYSVAAQFEECREKIIELPNIIRDLCHILYYGKVRIVKYIFCLKVFNLTKVLAFGQNVDQNVEALLSHFVYVLIISIPLF